MPAMPAPMWGGEGSVGPIVSGPYIGGTNIGRNTGRPNSAAPIFTGPFSVGGALPATTPQSNVLGAQSIRPTGPSGGFDPQYLQNLATAIGGLFSRPGGNLNFNPLGNLSDVSSPGLGFGNAPLPGLPSTLLQDAINGLAFMFNQPSTIGGGSFGRGGRFADDGGGGDNDGGGGRRSILQ